LRGCGCSPVGLTFLAQTPCVTRRLVPAIGGVAVVLSAVCLIASGVHRAEDFADPLVLTPAFWAAGAIAYTYRPQLRCARLLCLTGTLIAVSHLLAAAPPAVHALAVWPVNLASQLLFLLGFAAWSALLAVFPDGCVETGKERWWLRLIPTAAILFGTIGFFSVPTQPQLGVLAKPETPLPFWSTDLAWVHEASGVVFGLYDVERGLRPRIRVVGGSCQVTPQCSRSRSR